MYKPDVGFQRIRVPLSEIQQMLSTMREFGAMGCEVLVLWLGRPGPGPNDASVLRAYVPQQKPIKSEDGVGYFVSGETLFQLNKALAESGLRLIAQVHSHPQEAYHSEADDRYAIVTSEGGLSLVVPDFGKAAPDPSAWAVYRLHDRNWVEIPGDQVGKMFEIVDQ
jgi:proteasome lid subunit RPN8/RPN11